MNETQPQATLPRTLVAAIAGILVAVVPAVACDALMRKLGIFPASGPLNSDSLFALATGYRTVFSIAGSYVAAKLAPARPMRLAMILGYIGVAVNLLGLIATWNKGSELGPKWYPIALTLLALPCAWIGGKLAVGKASVSES